MTPTLSIDLGQASSIRVLVMVQNMGVPGVVGGIVSAVCASALPLHAWSEMAMNNTHERTCARVATRVRRLAYMFKSPNPCEAVTRQGAMNANKSLWSPTN